MPLNVHASLLPRHRGAAPIEGAILAGDAVSGVTIMRVIERMDAGPILLQRPLSLDPAETQGGLKTKLADLGADALIEALHLLYRDQLGATPQDESLATYTAPVKKDDALIDWNAGAITIERMTRAYDPWPVARTTWMGGDLMIWRARVIADSGEFTDVAAGTLVRLAPDPIVKCGTGSLVLLEVQAPGRRRMRGGGFHARAARYRRRAPGRMKPTRIAQAAGVVTASAPSVTTPAAVSRGQGLPARRAALEVLARVEQEGAFADVLLGHRLAAFPDPADRRLITKLVLATIAWQGRLDYELARISSRRLETLAPDILLILRLGLCQLRILTRIPRHAAVDTAVTLARRSRGGDRGAGFVNAVLRNALRNPIPLPRRSGDQLDYLSAALSHPRWIVERFVAWFGLAAAEALMTANNDAAPNVLRLNLARGEPPDLMEQLRANGLAIASSGRFAETVILAQAPSFDGSPLREGLCYPQSEASQLAVRMLAPPPGATVADCAAAPGGKSSHLAELVDRHGKVIALDISRSGLRKVASLALKLGHRNILATQADCAAALPLHPHSFDYVLLDAPCTGSGTLREHPEIRWRLRPGDFARMAKLQLRMLEQVSTLVRPGGVIVYAVCSVAPDEGEGVVRCFLDDHPEFAVDRAIPSVERFAGLIGHDGFMRTRPDQGGLDGFFAARLTRRA